MSISINFANTVYKKNKQANQIKIIIPKKYIKKACLRNKIRRRIKHILRINNINNALVKYFYEKVLDFQKLQIILLKTEENSK
jgi:ribonuclease P protein component